MRTGTGVVEEVCPNGLAKIQTNRNNLYSPCSDSMCADNVVIDAVNPIGAKKGQYVQFNIPDAGMGVKGIICFGVPLLLIIVCGVAGYLLGESWQVKPEMTAFAGMIAGGVMVFVWKYLVRPMGGVWNIYELLPAFIVSALAIVIVSLLTAAPSKEICDEFDSVGR